MPLPNGRIRKLRRSSDDASAAHALTFSCFHRKPFLSRERTCLWLVNAMDRARKRYALDIWAYVFMPNHVHQILWPRTHAFRPKPVLAAIKLHVSRRAVAWVKREAYPVICSIRLLPLVFAACVSLLHTRNLHGLDEPTSAPVSAAASELTADPVANRALLGRLGDTFRAEHNAAFSVITQCPPEKSSAILRLAEATQRTILAEMARLNIPTTRPPRKMTIVHFDRWSAFLDFAKDSNFTPTEGIPGFYDEPRRRCLVFDIESLATVHRQRDAIARAKAKRDEIDMQGSHAALLKTEIAAAEKSLSATVAALTSLVIQHEIAHQVLAEHGVVDARAPRWLREGLAMRYEQSPARAGHDPAAAGPSEQKLDVPGRPASRKADFQSAKQHLGEIGEAEFRRAVADDAYLSPTDDRAAYRYAVAWALVDHLMTNRTADFKTLLEAARKGDVHASERALSDFERIFGRLDSEFAAAIRKHVESLP